MQPPGIWCTQSLIEFFQKFSRQNAIPSRRGIIRTRLKISILGIFWLVVLERHKAFLCPPHQNLSQNTRFLGRRILRLSKIVIIEPKTQVILSDQRVFWCGLRRFLYLKIGVRIVLRRLTVPEITCDYWGFTATEYGLCGDKLN